MGISLHTRLNVCTEADASKHVRILTIYKILLININCAFVGLDNKKFEFVQTFLKPFVIVVVQHYISCF